jgi:arginine/lysine/ornithine decarboxylase
VELVKLADLTERVAAVMVVPYPPGIPIVMPGERFSAGTSMIVDYLKVLEAFDNEFPGFETEVHGVVPHRENSWTGYSVYCLKL